MKKVVITMRSFKKFISHDLLQLALIISLLKVDPDNYLGLQPGRGPDGGGGGGGVVLGAPPPLAGWPLLHHRPALTGKQVDSLLERYQEEILEDLNSLGRYSRLSLYGGVPVQLSAYLVDTELDSGSGLGERGTSSSSEADSDSGISDTDQASPRSPGPRDQDDADLMDVFEEEFDLQSLLTPPPEDSDYKVEQLVDDKTAWSDAFYDAARCEEAVENATVAAAVELLSDAESVLFEEEEADLVFGPEIPPELVEAGIPEIEDHGAIQLELMHMEEQLMHLDYDIEEINAASLYMDEKIALTISEEESEAVEDMETEDTSVIDEFSFFGPAAPFDVWEREAFADISDLLNHPAVGDSPAEMALAPSEPQNDDDGPISPDTILMLADGSALNLPGDDASDDNNVIEAGVVPPEAIQDFDLDLLGGSPQPELARSASDQLLQDLLDLDGSWSALRNDVMLPAQAASQPTASALLADVGYMPEEEALHRPLGRSISRDDDDLLEEEEEEGVTETTVKEEADLMAQVLKESEIFDAEIDLESSGIKMEMMKEEEIKLEVEEEEEVLLDQVVEVVPCPGYELDAEGACAQLTEDLLLEAVEDKGLLQFTLSRGMALAYNPSFNAAGFKNDHSSYVTNGRNSVKLETTDSASSPPAASDAATAAAPTAMAIRRRNESESSSGYGSDENRPSRDEKLARKAGLPFTARQLVDCSVEAFNDYITRPGLTKEQVKLCKDIRRRGKNKVAAQNCRRRKLETIEELQSQVESVRMRRAALLQEREQLESQRRRWSGKLELMEQRVLAGLGKNIAEFTLQVDATRVRVTARLTTEVGGDAVRSAAGGRRTPSESRGRH